MIAWSLRKSTKKVAPGAFMMTATAKTQAALRDKKS